MNHAMTDGLDRAPLATIKRPSNSLVVVPNVRPDFRVRQGTVSRPPPRLTADALHHSADHGGRRLIADVYHSEFQI